jgi:hypothetical protein
MRLIYGKVKIVYSSSICKVKITKKNVNLGKIAKNKIQKLKMYIGTA